MGRLTTGAVREGSETVFTHYPWRLRRLRRREHRNFQWMDRLVDLIYKQFNFNTKFSV